MDEKALKVLEIIINYGPISGPDILKYLNRSVNIKTIRTIIERWNHFFASIGDGRMQIENVRNRGYKFNHGYFQDAEVHFLKDVIQTSKLLNQYEKKRLVALCQPWLGLNQKQLIQPSSLDGFLNALTVVKRAIAQQSSLKFSYIDYKIGFNQSSIQEYRQRGNDPSDVTRETYLISPYEIMMHKGQYYVLSYCDKHPDNLTIFRIDRMAKLRLAKSQYFHQLKEIIDYEKKKEQMVNMFVGQKEAKQILIRFDQNIFQAIIDEFGKEAHFSYDIDGKPLLLLEDFAISEGLIGWILMMGEKVEVLAPSSLREMLYMRLEKMVKQYLPRNTV